MWNEWLAWLDEYEGLDDLLPHLGATGLVLLVGLILYIAASRMLTTLGDRTYLDKSMVVTLRLVLRWLTLVLLLAAVLQVWGVLGQFWAAATATVTLVAIGFVAVWSVLSNVLCSIILLATRPFRVGQWIELPPDDFGGEVVEVTLIHTVLRSRDGSELQVPNNLFFQRVRRVRKLGERPPADKSKDQADQP